MKISTEIQTTANHVGFEKAVELVGKAGFDAWDFSLFDMARYDWKEKKVKDLKNPLSGDDYLAFARKLKQIGLDNGIVCNQSHAPFPVESPEIRSYLKRAIECTAEAGGEICIIHPFNSGTPEENAELYNELLPFAKDCGVKIATENMWNWSNELGHSTFAACATPESFNAHLDAVNDDYLVACLDIGHAEMLGSDTSAEEMVKALGSRLKALHIHDNDKLHDTHQLPFLMDIDFVPIVKALKEIKYDGYFTLEADRFLSDYTAENVLDGLKEMASVARKLADMYEEF